MSGPPIPYSRDGSAAWIALPDDRVQCRPGSKSVVHRTIGGAVLLVTLAVFSALAQSARPDFNGVWRSVSTGPGSSATSITEVKQTGSTLALRPLIPKQPPMIWSIYSTDGQVLRTKSGRHVIERTGRWQGNQLVLRETAPGNAPWRRSTEQRILSLSSDGTRMIMTVHNLSDVKSTHDQAVVLVRMASSIR